MYKISRVNCNLTPITWPRRFRASLILLGEMFYSLFNQYGRPSSSTPRLVVAAGHETARVLINEFIRNCPWLASPLRESRWKVSSQNTKRLQ